MRDPSHEPFTHQKMPYMFSTPLRSLISKDLTNLFFAGRLASFSHVVFGSQRVMRTCATQGQAAGTAAAYGIAHGVDPIALKDHPEAVWSIQQQLLRDDAFIIGSLNEDPRDHARGAVVSASSERANASNCRADGSAANVISGQSRAVVTGIEPGGVPASQGVNGTNRWISVGLPATLSLALAGGAPVAVKQVQLTFDTGMHRKCSFSPQGKSGCPWGPQLETVRDYTIEGKDAGTGEWVALCNVTDNYQRRRVHTLPCAAPTPRPAPPVPPAPVVAAGSVAAALCNATDPAQRWALDDSGGAGFLVVRSADGKLCLGFDANTSAYGGHGNSVVARPCGDGDAAAPAPTAWKWTEAVGGSFLQTAAPHKSCSGFPGKAGEACECAHAVKCTACHGDDVYKPPTAVELYACRAGSHMKWSSLIVNDGAGGAPSGVLMTGGLCLQAPASQAPVFEAAPASTPEQRVRPKTARELEAEAAPAPAVTAVRVTVTKTNGYDDARINEIRLYDAEGVSPFPEKPQSA